MGKKIQSSFKQFLKSWYIFALQLQYLPELCYRTNDLSVFDQLLDANNLTKEELEGYKYMYAREGAWTHPINYYRNLLKAKDILNPKTIPIIRVPTLIVWGENDLALEKDLAEMSRPYVRNVQVEYVPNANHFVHHSKPDQVNSLIQEFVK